MSNTTVRYELQRRIAVDFRTAEETWLRDCIALAKTLKRAREELREARREDSSGAYRIVRVTTTREVVR